MTMTFGSAAKLASCLASCGERSAWRSQFAKRRPRTSAIAAKSSAWPSGSSRPRDRADAEAPVVGLLRRPALEDDHRRHLLGAHQVADVEALDAQRQHVEPERLLEPLERLGALLAAALGLQALLVEREPRVALSELEDAALVAALGQAYLDGGAPAQRERLGQLGALAEVALDDDLRRDRQSIGVVLQEELLDDVARRPLGLV